MIFLLTQRFTVFLAYHLSTDNLKKKKIKVSEKSAILKTNIQIIISISIFKE